MLVLSESEPKPKKKGRVNSVQLTGHGNGQNGEVKTWQQCRRKKATGKSIGANSPRNSQHSFLAQGHINHSLIPA
jgi:hypothetical protein